MKQCGLIYGPNLRSIILQRQEASCTSPLLIFCFLLAVLGLFYILKKHPEADQCSIRLKDEKSEPVDIQVRLQQNKTSDFYWYYFNQKNGQLDKLKSSKNLQLGSKITSMNYDLHTGSIGGLATKIISFIASLICASLPITGCIIWLNKLKKSKKRLPPNEN